MMAMLIQLLLRYPSAFVTPSRHLGQGTHG